MKSNKIIATILSIGLLTSLPLVASAETSNETLETYSSSLAPNFDNEVVSNINDILTWSEELDTSEFQKKYESIDTSVFSKLCWNVPTAVPSTEMLNVEYANLVLSFESKGFGTKAELEIPEFEAGYSASITEQFNKTFGDLSELKIPELTLPDGWTFSEIMADSKRLRDSETNQFYESEAYKTVIDSISIGNCFEIAKQEMKMPSLGSAADMSSRLEGLSSGFESEWLLQTSQDINAINSMAKASDLDYKTEVSDELSTIFGVMQGQNAIKVMKNYKSLFHTGIQAQSEWSLDTLIEVIYDIDLDFDENGEANVDSNGTTTPIAPGTDMSEPQPMPPLTEDMLP